MINTMRPFYDYILIDTAPVFSDITMTALENSEPGALDFSFRISPLYVIPRSPSILIMLHERKNRINHQSFNQRIDQFKRYATGFAEQLNTICFWLERRQPPITKKFNCIGRTKIKLAEILKLPIMSSTHAVIVRINIQH